MSDTERGFPIPYEDGPGEVPELFRDSFGIKELQSMLEVEETDIEDVLRILEEVLQETPPDPADTAACEEYRIMMIRANELAQRQKGRASVLRTFQEELDRRVAELSS